MVSNAVDFVNTLQFGTFRGGLVMDLAELARLAVRR